jgi:hypothetical protein
MVTLLLRGKASLRLLLRPARLDSIRTRRADSLGARQLLDALQS